MENKSFWIRYAKYHLRWQTGFLIATPVMYICIDYLKMDYWLAVIIFQFIGALIFYPIDAYLFKKKQKSEQ